MIPVLVVTLLALGALLYVAAPLKAGPRRRTEVEPEGRAVLRERKDAALEALVDLEEEAAMGKLSERDLAALRERYEREALEALAALDSVDLTGTDPLEAEIAAARQRLTCPSCGAPREPGTRCVRCGA